MKIFNFSCSKNVLLTLTIFLLFSLGIPLSVKADFNFYADDLISKESYRRISMDFRDASLKSILKIFSEQAGLNFIAAQNVQDRTVTLYLDNVPLQEALNKIMSANKLTYELDAGSNIFIVKESGQPDVERITKVYYLKYTRLKSSNLQKVINAGPPPIVATPMGSAGAAGGGTSAPGGSTGSSGASAAGGGEGGIEDSIKAVLTPNGKLVQDPRTNSLIVTDIPSQFDVIEKVIALLDTPTPQVMIEVEMLDVDKNTVDEMGVQTSQHLLTATAAKTFTSFPFFASSGALPKPAFQYGTLDSSMFTATLDFLTTDTKTKFLARPRILTLNNESAQIQILTAETVSSTTTSTQSTGSNSASFTTVPTGVQLNVTPQVDAATGTVTMYIVPSVTQTRNSTFKDSLGNTIKDAETRSTSTTLMVKDGETIVVGGLIRSEDETTITKMPFFGDLPIIGAAFRHKEKKNEERELIVFITPHIVGQDNVIALAKGEPIGLARTPMREQSSAVGRKEQVDNMLERWEN